MCIAIYKPAGKTISKESLQQCFRSNPDGAGFMWVESRKLNIKKGFFTFDSFYEEYIKHEQHQCAIHFRIKTHGQISIDNCHPFSITSNLAFIHNGVVSGYNDPVKSDTLLFQEEVLSPMITKFGRRLLKDAAYQSLIENVIGWSKLVFLDANGDHYIYNAHKGNWDDGVWYSNTSYKPVKIIEHSWKGKDVDYGKSYGHNVIVPNNDNRTKVMPYAGKTYFLKKSTGKHIYQGDWVKLKYDFRNLRQDDVFEVIKVQATSHCILEDTTGQQYEDIPGALLSLYYPATIDQALTHDRV